MKNIKKLALLFMPFLALAVFILVTDPHKLPLLLLLVPFVLLGAGCYFVVREFLGMTPISRRKGSFMAGILASIVLLGVLLQSIRQLSVKDFLILIALLVGTTFYMRRIDI